MQVLGLGKINVPTSGTKVAFSVTPLKVHKVLISFDPADTVATVSVKDGAGNVLATIATGNPAIVFGGGGAGGNEIDLSSLFADASANNKGPFVSYELR